MSDVTLADAMFSTSAATRAMGDDAHLVSLVRFEAALARAQAETGVIDEAHAEAIDAALAGFEALRGDARAKLLVDAQKAGSVAVPLVKLLTEHVRVVSPTTASFVHFGATSQDAIDTAHVLQIRDAVGAIAGELRQLARGAAHLAEAHRGTLMLGRTLLQPATPITFGLKAAQWLVGALDALDRLERDSRSALVLQFGGAAGTLGSLGEKGPAVATALAAQLGLALPMPALPWQTRRGALAGLGATLAIACGQMGKIARDISLMMQFELSEVAEPSGEGRGGSSAMPHKRNPVRCMIALANAARAPGLVATLLAGLVEEHERALGGWQAEWVAWPELVGCAAGATAAMAQALEGLVVDAPRMASNLAALRGLPMTETVSLALAPRLGKAAAHAAVERAARAVSASSDDLAAALGRDPQVAAVFDRKELCALTDPFASRGSSDAFISAALSYAAERLGSAGFAVGETEA